MFSSSNAYVFSCLFQMNRWMAAARSAPMLGPFTGPNRPLRSPFAMVLGATASYFHMGEHSCPLVLHTEADLWGFFQLLEGKKHFFPLGQGVPRACAMLAHAIKRTVFPKTTTQYVIHSCHCEKGKSRTLCLQKEMFF